MVSVRRVAFAQRAPLRCPPEGYQKLPVRAANHRWERTIKPVVLINNQVVELSNPSSTIGGILGPSTGEPKQQDTYNYKQSHDFAWLRKLRAARKKSAWDS